jgi:hypothetical protein
MKKTFCVILVFTALSSVTGCTNSALFSSTLMTKIQPMNKSLATLPQATSNSITYQGKI